MIFKNILLTFIGLVLVFRTAAKAYIMLGETRESPKTDRTYSLIDYDSNSYAIMRFDKAMKYAETEVYNRKLKHQGTYISTPDARSYGGVINLEGRIYMLFSRFRENKELARYEDVSLWAMPMRRDSFCIGTDSLALIAPFIMRSAFYRGNFVLSPDRSKLLVYDYEEEGDIEEVRGLTNEITLRVYDNKFELLWSKKVNLAPNPSEKRVMAIKKLRVNNQGEVAILTDYFRNHRSYSLKEVTADPTLFFVGAAPNNFARFTPNLGDLFFNQIDFTYDYEGNIVWFGFYSKHKYYQQAGYFYVKINAERSKVLHKKIVPFGEDLLKNMLQRKKLPKNPEMRNYELLSFRLTAKGELIISAEYQPYGISNFKSHSVLVMRILADGNLRWAKHIYKFNTFSEQLSVFLQHYLQLDGDNVYLLFNQGIYAETGKALAMRLDADGNLTEKNIFGYLNQEAVICPSLSYPLPNGQVFLSLQSRFFKFHQCAILDFRKLFE